MTDDTQPATRGDLKLLKSDLQSEMKEMRSELRSEMAEMKSELRSEMQEIKSELKGDIHRLAMEIVRTRDRMEELNRITNAKMDAGFERITGMIDSFLGKLEMYARESVTIPNTLDDHGHKLNNHEKRITILETAPGGSH